MRLFLSVMLLTLLVGPVSAGHYGHYGYRTVVVVPAPVVVPQPEPVVVPGPVVVPPPAPVVNPGTLTAPAAPATVYGTYSVPYGVPLLQVDPYFTVPSYGPSFGTVIFRTNRGYRHR